MRDSMVEGIPEVDKFPCVSSIVTFYILDLILGEIVFSLDPQDYTIYRINLIIIYTRYF